MAENISQQLRREVRARARFRCEYCHSPESVLLVGCEVDHVISRKHGGLTESANLALSCARCNRAKGTDLGSVNPSGILVRFFNPRIAQWSEHFRFEGDCIVGLTPIGEVTVRLLRFNENERRSERKLLRRGGFLG